MMMCLRAHGIDCDEDEVNRTMGARPMQGATWESALACGQHYGMRCTLVTPATLGQIKSWTDRGVPVMIAWNPEGRPWSHASVIFDVDEDNVHVADPNIPDPSETVRVVPKAEFYSKWYEKWPDYLVRRPAMAVEREVTSDGRQVVASSRRQISAVQIGEALVRVGTTQEAVRGAYNDYVQAVTNLEAGADLVAVATNRLRALGFPPDETTYPFAESIEVVASDIWRWRNNIERIYDPDDRLAVTHRVASRFLQAERYPAECPTSSSSFAGKE
jgi:hypothetical protein